MREILFRGKRVDNDEWVEGDSLVHSMYKKGDVCIGVIEDLSIYSVIPESIGEFTSLTDKNGTKIFEGDIVKLFLRDCVEIGVIQYNDKMYRFVFCHISIDGEYGGEYGFDMTCVFEVIGNIHDNPELLERGCDNG